MSRSAGGVSKQVLDIFQDANMLDIGRHDGHHTKTEYREMARAEGITDRHLIAQKTPITNSGTWTKVRDIVQDLGHYQRASGAGNQMRQITPETIRGFIASRIADGVSDSYVKSIRMACNKFAACLGDAEKSAKIFEVTKEFAGAGVNKELDQIRFNDPQAVIDKISDPKCQIIAEIQLSTGLRVNDARYIRLNPDGHSIEVHSKAGRVVPQQEIGADLWQKVASYVEDGKNTVSLATYDHYRYEVGKAARAAGETVARTHSFRHNYAYNLNNDLQAAGAGKYSAQAQVSKALYHERLDITTRYIDK